MNADGDLSPAIKSILESARARDAPSSQVSVRSRSLSDAFAAAKTAGRTPIIAEIKPTSPTTTGTRDSDPVKLAHAMIDGGAAALSVLTEPDHFGGSPDALRTVRNAVDVPVLRKDFILRESHLDVVTADVILLIARFVDDLPLLVQAAHDRGFQVLLEVHSKPELERALDTPADYIGINNRDLTKLEVDLSTFERLAPLAPESKPLIAESGISRPSHVTRMREAGASGLLIGTAIMDGDVKSNTERFVNA